MSKVDHTDVYRCVMKHCGEDAKQILKQINEIADSFSSIDKLPKNMQKNKSLELVTHVNNLYHLHNKLSQILIIGTNKPLENILNECLTIGDNGKCNAELNKEHELQNAKLYHASGGVHRDPHNIAHCASIECKRPHLNLAVNTVNDNTGLKHILNILSHERDMFTMSEFINKFRDQQRPIVRALEKMRKELDALKKCILECCEEVNTSISKKPFGLNPEQQNVNQKAREIFNYKLHNNIC